MNPKIIIVDDEYNARFAMKKALSKEKYEIEEAENGLVALEKIPVFHPDVAFLDLNMPQMDGITALQKINELENPPLVIVVTAHGSEKIAVESMKKGAYDYIAKPYDVEELRIITRNALEKLSLLRENIQLKEKINLQDSFGELIGESKEMQSVYDMIEKVANTDVTVLITGENGTGKELVAREIHKRSSRIKGKFVPVNCASVPENLIESELFGTEKGAFTDARERKGKLEEANKGTLFLDEIGDMGLNMQAKVLRVLNDRIFERLGGNTSIQADVRFISATNKDLDIEIEEENFREDLYYRIKVVDIVMPPLRERATDIPLLTEHFLKLFCKKHKKNIEAITPKGLQLLMDHCWPGNVRELKNTIEKMVVLADSSQITEQDLPENIVQGNVKKSYSFPSSDKVLNLWQNYINTNKVSFKNAKRAFVREFEKVFIVEKLKKHQGNITQTANTLGIPRQSLQQKLRELAINAREFTKEQ